MFDLFETLAEITKPEPETGIYLTGDRIADDIGNKYPDLSVLPIPSSCTLKNV